MSDTPRTDEQDGYLGEGAVDSDFARQLERELSAKDQQLSALRLVCGTTDANKFETALDRATARIGELEKEVAETKAWGKSWQAEAERMHDATRGTQP
jgi:hydrogenase maturation factor